ncbi:MAG: hypothetical protein A2Y73_06730 [Chloroflexi bacterium RBG_13_56_8]|nr:MAG: hypothetical protein A2Y73_06730 [Chloroflexi bacterium RBG_13_56_8]
MNFQDILVALMTCLDAASGAVLAAFYGFSLIPSGIGFLVGAIGVLAWGLKTPLSFQQEGIVLAGTLGTNKRERVSIIVGAAVLTGLIGILGFPQAIVDSLGPGIFYGMLAGVGLYLARVALNLAARNWLIGLPVLVVAILVQLLTDNLVWAITASIPLGMLLGYLLKETPIKGELEKSGEEASNSDPSGATPLNLPGVLGELSFYRPSFLNWKVVRGLLACSMLTLGGNITYSAINAEIAGSAAHFNEVTILSGVADLFSALFGGASMEVIVSATAAAPHATIAAFLFMAIFGILLLIGLVRKFARYVPLAATGGYLFVIGAMLSLPFNAADAFAQGNPVVVAITMAVTAWIDPFTGMVAGVLVQAIMGWLGVL